MGRTEAQKIYNREWMRTHRNPESSRMWAKNNPEKTFITKKAWKERNKEKNSAHAAVNKAIKSGKLIRPDSCSRCNVVGKIEAHHADYTKKLEVIWLCNACHLGEHPRYRIPSGTSDHSEQTNGW